MVCPTISGTTVERRDHVRITRLSPRRFISTTFSIRWSSTNGPFLIDLGISYPLRLPRPSYPRRLPRPSYPRRLPRPSYPRRLPRPSYPRRLPRRRTMSLSEAFGLRVRPSFLPHGLVGWRPPLDLPSPPPSGWSTGFMATPRTLGRTPRQRFRP